MSTTVTTERYGQPASSHQTTHNTPRIDLLTDPLFLCLLGPRRSLLRPPRLPLAFSTPQQLILQFPPRTPLGLLFGLPLLPSLFHHLVILAPSLLGLGRVRVGRMSVGERTDEVGVVVWVDPDRAGRVGSGVDVECVTGLRRPAEVRGPSQRSN